METVSAEVRCNVCGSHSHAAVPEDSMEGDSCRSWCSECDDYTDHEVTEVED